MRHAGVIGWKYVTKRKKLKGNRSKVGQDTCGSHGPSYILWYKVGDVKGVQQQVGRIQVRVMGLELRVGDLPDSGSGKPPPEGCCWATYGPPMGHPATQERSMVGLFERRTRRKTGELPFFQVEKCLCSKILLTSLKLKKGRDGAVLRFWKTTRGRQKVVHMNLKAPYTVPDSDPQQPLQ